MRRMVIAAALLFSMALAALGFGVANTSAAPITCNGNQTVVKTGPGQWDCLNNGGNYTGTDRTKNPNDQK